MLPSLPRGPTGKPLRIGLAEAFQLPSLRTGTPMLTLDLRVRQPLEHEAARRAEARKAHAFDAARRAEARKAHAFDAARRAEARKAAVRRPRQRSAASEEGEGAEEAEEAEAEAAEGKAAAAAAAAAATAASTAAAATPSFPSAGAPISGRSGRGAVVGARSPGLSFAECQQLVIGAMLEASGEAVRGLLSAC